MIKKIIRRVALLIFSEKKFQNIIKKFKKIIIFTSQIFFYPKFYFRILFFKKKKIIKINQNLIIISQIQRSGGTLLSQLFDNHSKIYSYPYELILTSPKYDWSKKLNFNTYLSNDTLRKIIKDKNYQNLSKGKISNLKENFFDFDPILQKKIFNFYTKKNKSLRNCFDAYFTSFFNSLMNFKNLDNTKKKYIMAFIPRFIFMKSNLDTFFKMYKNGLIISIIRHPLEWLKSAQKHSKTYKDSNSALKMWFKNANSTLDFHAHNKEKIIIIKFSDLILKSEKLLKKLCKIIHINFDKKLLIPTFNGNTITSDSSFKAVIGFIDKNVIIKDIDHAKYYGVNKKLLKDCLNIYKKCILLSILNKKK